MDRLNVDGLDDEKKNFWELVSRLICSIFCRVNSDMTYTLMK